MSKLASTEDKGFNGKIFQCIDKALDTFGEGVKLSFYYQIEKQYSVPKEKIPFKPNEIIEYLRLILGPTGSSFVEKLIVGEIRNMFGLGFEGNMPLTTVIREARKKFLSVTDFD
jgi:hypothetical protein